MGEVNSFEDPRKIDRPIFFLFQNDRYRGRSVERSPKTKEISKIPHGGGSLHDRFETVPPRFSHLADRYELAGSPIKY